MIRKSGVRVSLGGLVVVSISTLLTPLQIIPYLAQILPVLIVAYHYVLKSCSKK